MAKKISLAKTAGITLAYSRVRDDGMEPPAYADNPFDRVPNMPKLLSENVTRIFALYAYKTPKGIETIEGRVLYEPWHDFCGGGLFYSPQVAIHTPRETWDGMAQFVYSETRIPHTRQYDYHRDWSKVPALLPMLNDVYGQKYVSSAEAEEFMWNTIAAALLRKAWNSNRRFLVGVDRSGGHNNLTMLVKRMEEIEGMEVPSEAVTIYEDVTVYPHPRKHPEIVEASAPTAWARVPDIGVTKTSGRNWNSDNDCTVYTILLAPDMDCRDPEEMDDVEEEAHVTCSCGAVVWYTYPTLNTTARCYRCDKEVAIPEEHQGVKEGINEDVLKKYRSRAFMYLLPRETWRNG